MRLIMPNYTVLCADLKLRAKFENLSKPSFQTAILRLSDFFTLLQHNHPILQHTDLKI